MFILLIFLSLFSGCTYSINMVHTSGDASDVIDEEQSPKADLRVPIDLPHFPGLALN